MHGANEPDLKRAGLARWFVSGLIKVTFDGKSEAASMTRIAWGDKTHIVRSCHG